MPDSTRVAVDGVASFVARGLTVNHYYPGLACQGWFFEEALDLFGIGAELRRKGAAVHIAEEALQHLSCHRAVCEVAAKVDTADEQFAGAYLCFKNQRELAIGIPVVNYLDDGV